MKCYLCGSEEFSIRSDSVRGSEEINVLQCKNCSLVQLSDFSHIDESFYANSGMHGDEVQSISEWMLDTSTDDSRRAKELNNFCVNKKVLDFGCGNGGFLKRIKKYSSAIAGIELEKRVQDYYKNQINIFSSLNDVKTKFNLITAFHVVEHLKDPISVLRQLAKLLEENGKLVIEVPNSEDALLTLYESEVFKKFSYWDQHLFLFNAQTLNTLATISGFSLIKIKHVQRYPLSNHLYWLSKGLPGGHEVWSNLNSNKINQAYSSKLAALGQTDTIFGIFEVKRND